MVRTVGVGAPERRFLTGWGGRITLWPLYVVFFALWQVLIVRWLHALIYVKVNMLELPVPAAHSKDLVTTAAKKCGSSAIEIPQSYFQSQSSEDERLMAWFKKLCGGTYIELGALDGVTFSNSHAFNKGLHWKGVLIELDSDNYKEMVVNRPNEIATIHAGVCSRPQTLHSVTRSFSNKSSGVATGGIWEFASPSFRQYWWSNIGLDDPGIVEVECNTLDSLLLKHALNTFVL